MTSALKSANHDVLAIGNAIVDIIAQVDGARVAELGLVPGSMNLIDEARAEMFSARMGAAARLSGGSAGNTIAGLASFGGKAAYFGKVKDDALGTLFRNDLRAQGVVFESTPDDTGPATAHSFIMVTPDGERTMSTFLGACVNLSESDIIRATVEASRVVYMEGYLFDRPQAMAAFRLAARMAHDAGRTVSITLSDSFCVERHRDAFLDLVRNDIDIVFANESELKALYQTQDFNEALKAIRGDCDIAVLTRSQKGSVVVRKEETVAVAAHPVSKVVDMTGAGDLYAAGFLFGFTRGEPLARCASLASMAAAEVISHMGARPETSLRALAKTAGLLDSTAA